MLLCIAESLSYLLDGCFRHNLAVLNNQFVEQVHLYYCFLTCLLQFHSTYHLNNLKASLLSDLTSHPLQLCIFMYPWDTSLLQALDKSTRVPHWMHAVLCQSLTSHKVQQKSQVSQRQGTFWPDCFSWLCKASLDQYVFPVSWPKLNWSWPLTMAVQCPPIMVGTTSGEDILWLWESQVKKWLSDLPQASWKVRAATYDFGSMPFQHWMDGKLNPWISLSSMSITLLTSSQNDRGL